MVKEVMAGKAGTAKGVMVTGVNMVTGEVTGEEAMIASGFSVRGISDSLVLSLEKLARMRAFFLLASGLSGSSKDGRSFFRRRFSDEMSKRYPGKHFIGVGSGSDALVLSLKALGVGLGDEVIVPAFGCSILASSVCWVGARPIFVDITSHDYAVDVSAVADNITHKTKAILFAHLFGVPSLGVFEIADIGEKHNIPIIEDASQCFGAKMIHNGQVWSAGEVGTVGCFSFSSGKPFPSLGKAGGVITSQENLGEAVRALSLYGSQDGRNTPPRFVGVNARMDELNAASLVASLPFYNYWLRKREEVAQVYSSVLSGIPMLSIPRIDSQVVPVWHQYAVRVPQREKLLAGLREQSRRKGNKFSPQAIYPAPLSSIQIFGDGDGDFPVAEQVSKEILLLPLGNAISLGEAVDLAQTVRSFLVQGGS